MYLLFCCIAYDILTNRGFGFEGFPFLSHFSTRKGFLRGLRNTELEDKFSNQAANNKAIRTSANKSLSNILNETVFFSFKASFSSSSKDRSG